MLQLCYDGWWKMLGDSRMEYVNGKNIIFFYWEKLSVRSVFGKSI